MKIIKDQELLNKYIHDADFIKVFSSKISDSLQLLFYEPGEYLINNGIPSRHLLFLVDGECRFFTITSEGYYVSFGSTNTFELFGEVSSLWGLPPNNSVQALKPTYCLGIDLEIYRDTLLNDNAFLRYVCRLLADRVLTSNKSLTSYVGTKAENRLAAYILQNSQNNVFTIPLTRTSEALAISYRHLLRLMSSLCAQNILVKKSRRYKIRNLRKLREISLAP